MYRFALSLTATLIGSVAAAQEMVPATLAGHAAIPAFSFTAPPADAPAEAWLSGRFTSGTAPVNTPQSVEANGLMRPFFGQPLQGISGYALTRDDDGAIFALIDNGFGSKANSSDALLSFTRIMPDFDTGEIEVLDRVWLTPPAAVKRVTLIDTAQIDAEGFVARLAQIDLMDIADPDGLARLPTDGDVPAGRFVFPFVTIESVIRDGDEHILVGNDNNLPFSAGRRTGVADSNEMVRLHVPDLLAAQ